VAGQFIGAMTMTSTLTYRGHEYLQNKDMPAEKQAVHLTYRRQIYQQRKQAVNSEKPVELCYRGCPYQRS